MYCSDSTQPPATQVEMLAFRRSSDELSAFWQSTRCFDELTRIDLITAQKKWCWLSPCSYLRPP
jgi:hypothetical protein